MTDKFKQYLLIFALTFTLGGSGFLLNFIFISRAYENTPYDKIVEIQQRENALYGTALNPNDLNYKLALVKNRRPEIISWGSSRTMQIREEEFQVPFTNCGGVFSTLNEGKFFLKSMLPIHKPKFILWGLDYWWFNKKWEADERRRFIDETAITQEKLMKPFEWFIDGKLTLQDYFSVLFGNRRNRYTNYSNLGIHAIKTSDGYRPDGSYLETSMIFGLENRIEIMKKEINFITSGTNERAQMGYDSFVDEERWQQFVSIVEEVKRQNIQFILFLPPVAPRYMQAIGDLKDHIYVENLMVRLRTLNEEFYDFTDSRKFHADDREFSDGWHVGEVGYLRLLQEIRYRNPQSQLLPFMSVDDFNPYIKKFSNHLMVLFPKDSMLFNRPEPSL